MNLKQNRKGGKMTRTKKLFSMAVVLTLSIFFACHAFAGESTLYRTTTTFTVKAERDIQVTVTFNPDGSLNELKRCFSKEDCEAVSFDKFTKLSERKLYTCVPLVGEKAEGTRVILEEKPYDCQYVTAIEATDQVMLKAGNNTSCPYYYDGRWKDPCKGM